MLRAHQEHGWFHDRAAWSRHSQNAYGMLAAGFYALALIAMAKKGKRFKAAQVGELFHQGIDLSLDLKWVQIPRHETTAKRHRLLPLASRSLKGADTTCGRLPPLFSVPSIYG